jgi:hypothetical protein
MSIYHFSHALGGIFASLPQCPTLNMKIDKKTLGLHAKEFRKSFPLVEVMRHSIAHYAELTKTPRDFEKMPLLVTTKAMG